MVIHTLFVILGMSVTNLKGIIEIKHAIEKFNESQRTRNFIKLNSFKISFLVVKLVNRYLPPFK